MKIESLKLVYFSPTGTTKKILERIAQGINHSTVEIADITRPEGRKRQLETLENELLIIGVPIYFGRVQTDAIEWLHTIEAHNTPTVCVVVYGNREYDDALLELKDTAVKNGGMPIACAAYIGEHSFSNSETPIAAGRPDADDLSHAELFGKKIEEKILSVPSINHVTDITVPGNYPYRDMTDRALAWGVRSCFLHFSHDCTPASFRRFLTKSPLPSANTFGSVGGASGSFLSL